MKGDRFKGIPRNSPWRINEAIDKAMANPVPEAPVRAKKPRQNTERDTIHAPVMEWIYENETTYPALRFAFHTPNEGRRGYKGQQTIAQMGVRKGVPDLMLPLSSGSYWRGIALEFKAPGKLPTPEQADYLLHLRGSNWYADICESSGQAIQNLKASLGFGSFTTYRITTEKLVNLTRLLHTRSNDTF